MADALKAFIRHTRLYGKHVAPPDSDAQERLEARIAAWLALAHTHGVETARAGVERAISIPKPKNWFSKAKEVVASLVASIVDTVEGWISDATDGEADISESDIAAMVTQELEAFAENKAEQIATYEVPAAFENGVLETFKDAGFLTKVWIVQDNPCPPCQENADVGSIPIDSAFPSGLDSPPQHGHCKCSVWIGEE